MDKRSLLFIACVTASFFAVQALFPPAKGRPAEERIGAPAPSESTPSSPDPQALIASTAVALPGAPGGETFYLLQNSTQQLVFSNRGGALAEINLPLQSPDHPTSLVKEIQIDREIIRQSPLNARFPLFATQAGAEGEEGGFYPLIRRTLIDSEGSPLHRLAPRYYALAILNGKGEIATTDFRMDRLTDGSIQFSGSTGAARITKTYRLHPTAPYCFTLDVQIDGDASDLWLSSGVPDVELVSGSYSPQLKTRLQTATGASDIDELSLPKADEPKGNQAISPDWISNCNGFLGIIVDPLTKTRAGYQTRQIPGDAAPTRLSLIGARHHQYPAANYPGYQTLLPLSSGAQTFRVFAGPYDEALLKELDELFGDPVKRTSPDYAGAISIQGWFSFISQPFAAFLSLLIQLFYAVTRSWAASILLLTVALRAMMYPLNTWSIRSQAKMQELSPKVQAIQEKYKKDPKRAQLETVQLYKETGINPMSGCIPILLQMPFLFGMFYLLKSSFPLRGAPFIPGWIDDLAAPDVLFTWETPLWFFGNQFHLLPILMGFAMWLQQKFTSKLPKDASQLTDAQKQQKMMGALMAILFTGLFYHFPSGLNLYFMFSTLLGVGQQLIVQKKMAIQPSTKASST
jgi:YidC/Oxa1 family membrane protein insertase